MRVAASFSSLSRFPRADRAFTTARTFFATLALEATLTSFHLPSFHGCLANTMTDMPVTLFCLVDGEATSQAFSIDIEQTRTVEQLKKVIKTEIPDTFKDVDAKDLTLWRVSISMTDNDDKPPILLDNFPDKDKMRLGPVMRLSKVFPEDFPEGSINIIVQRPSQSRSGNAPLH